jgi:hypothetical protein
MKCRDAQQNQQVCIKVLYNSLIPNGQGEGVDLECALSP